MYRVVIYVLAAYVVVACGLSFTDALYYSPQSMMLSLIVIALVGLATHYLCSLLWKAPANLESTLITLLILFLIFDPVVDVNSLMKLALVSVIAILGKYVLAWNKLHIINPVVLAAVVVSVAGIVSATWWIGNYAMFALVLLGGLLVTAKIRRWELVLSTILVAFLVTVISSWWQGALTWETVEWFFLAWPIVFLATIMVTEPLSTPAGKHNHILYGSLVGGLSSIYFAWGPIISSPELALLIGNLAFYPTTLRARLVLTLKRIEQVARETWEYSFVSEFPLSFQAGQYLEWTLPHKNHDRRGIRRYFTLASSPTEPELKLGLRIPAKSSRFKEEIGEMKPGDVIYATSLDGDFILPKDVTNHPLVFIAGGIGVTPFRSMVKYLLDTLPEEEKMELTLFYCNKHQEESAWSDLWEEAQERLGMQTVQVVDEPNNQWSGETGFLTRAMLEKYLGDDLKRHRYYLSGPPAMVQAYTTLLKGVGVPHRRIIKDFFPGLA